MWKEIEPTRWDEFLRSFSHEHQGWLVFATPRATEDETNLDVLQPLKDIRLIDDDGDLSAIVSLGGDRPRSLLVEHPTRIAVEETDDGARQGLAIDGEVDALQLRFRVAIRAEMVDGVLD
jgi:hypothetical protein